MALLSLIFGEKAKARIGIVELDASLSETHSMSAEVTNHPVEEGSEISDHIRKQPDSIQISGVVSNTPLVYLASIQAPSPLHARRGKRQRSECFYGSAGSDHCQK
jgi:hypothetical protein